MLDSSVIRLLLTEAIQALKTAGVPEPRVDAELLLAHFCTTEGKRSSLWLANPTLSPSSIKCFRNALNRRCHREPLAYILGFQVFMGFSFVVDSSVMVPRPETELLVEVVLDLLDSTESGWVLADACTGCGCIPISLAHKLSGSEFHATDISADALSVARINADRLKVSSRIHFVQGDMLSPLEFLGLAERLDVLTCNPPYIPQDQISDLQPEIVLFEPRHALEGGIEGLEFYPRLLEEGLLYLKSGGVLICEVGIGQAPRVKAMIKKSHAYNDVEEVKDYQGIERLVLARKR